MWEVRVQSSSTAQWFKRVATMRYIHGKAIWLGQKYVLLVVSNKRFCQPTVCFLLVFAIQDSNLFLVPVRSNQGSVCVAFGKHSRSFVSNQVLLNKFSEWMTIFLGKLLIS